MTADSPLSKGATYRDDERDVLESLKGLSIKNFHDCNNDGTGPTTPSSTNASLRTPPALRSSQVFLAPGERSLPGSDWYPTIPPNAPHMKDLDSFTEHTGQGSFDFSISNGGAEEVAAYPLFCHPIDGSDDTLEDVLSPSTTIAPTSPAPDYTNYLALNLLPCASDSETAVRAWIEGIAATHEDDEDSTPRKRRRSLTASSEAEARRVRAWSPTVEPSHAPLSGTRRHGYPTERKEPEAPD